ncbi:MAG: hypothetical protein ACRENZ_08165, partial [Thermodesulfobacteriota bacterium]
MGDFLDKADELRKSEPLGDFQSDFDNVFNAILKLQVVHSKSALDLDNIESVFATFEMAKLLNKFPGMTKDQIEILVSSIRRLILKTLDLKVRYPCRQGKFVRTYYDAFSKLIEDLNLQGNKSRCSIITFNYDIALDQSLESNKYLLEYYISDNPKQNLTPYLKLHGSLNWFECECGGILSWSISDITKTLGTDINEQRTYYNIPISESLPPPNLKHCGKKLKSEPFIVPPTWNKTAHHQNISNVWSRAAHELSEAEHIIVSGYSLP